MSNKISEETKKAVLDMHKRGFSQRKIAKMYGIAHSSVGRIINTGRKKIHCTLVPILNIPLMSDERFRQIAAEQKKAGGSHIC